MSVIVGRTKIKVQTKIYFKNIYLQTWRVDLGTWGGGRVGWDEVRE